MAALALRFLRSLGERTCFREQLLRTFSLDSGSLGILGTLMETPNPRGLDATSRSSGSRPALKSLTRDAHSATAQRVAS